MKHPWHYKNSISEAVGQELSPFGSGDSENFGLQMLIQIHSFALIDNKVGVSYLLSLQFWSGHGLVRGLDTYCVFACMTTFMKSENKYIFNGFRLIATTLDIKHLWLKGKIVVIFHLPATAMFFTNFLYSLPEASLHYKNSTLIPRFRIPIRCQTLIVIQNYRNVRCWKH